MFTHLCLLIGTAVASPLVKRASLLQHDVKDIARSLVDSSSIGSSPHTLPVTRKRSTTSGSELAVRAATVTGTYGTTDILLVEHDQILVTDVEVGDQCFELVVDTGSSDTWVIQTNFSCVSDLVESAEPESYCAFGPTYNISSTFDEISDENFRVGYADGEFMEGITGYETVTLANITVEQQEIGVGNYGWWKGDGTSSGILGLAYPALTSVYSGTNVSNDSRTNQVEYNPIFTNMYVSGYVQALFTLVLDRNDSASTLTLGGLPTTGPGSGPLNFTSTSIEVLRTNPSANPIFSTQHSYYLITPESFSYQNATGNSSLTAVNTTEVITTLVDSGTSLIYLPSVVATPVLDGFSPAGFYSEDAGADVVYCNATAPAFGVTVEGTTFYVNAEDMIVDTGLDDGLCLSGVQDGGGATNILGDVFLRNVIAVFDVGASEMRFAAREDY